MSASITDRSASASGSPKITAATADVLAPWSRRQAVVVVPENFVGAAIVEDCPGPTAQDQRPGFIVSRLGVTPCRHPRETLLDGAAPPG